jgi:hypothetical protein
VEGLLVRDDTLYVGGRFLGVGGIWRPMLAALDANSAAVLPFDALASGVTGTGDPEVAAMSMVGDTLYVAGNFTHIGGRARVCLAALNAATGAALDWTAPSLGPWYQGYPPPLCTAVAASGGALYVGGWFETVGGQNRPFATALSRETGNETGWNPRPNLGVYALDVRGDTAYMGGMFGMVGGWKPRHHLAALDATTGAVMPWDPNPDGYVVTALALRGDRLFVSGDFATIGGQPRSRFAALDTMTGKPIDWNPGANDVASSLLLSGDTLIVGGYFTQVGGKTRNYLAAINTATGEVTSWNPDADYPVLTIVGGGDLIYVGGIFLGVGGQPRNGLAAVDGITGALSPWNPDPDVPSVDALLASGNTLYVGGSFNQIGGQSREALAALDAKTGEATPWNPWGIARDSPPKATALALVGGTLYVGGNFAGMGGGQRTCLAAVDTATGLATDWDPGANDVVWSLTTYGSTLYAGGGFSRLGGLPCGGLAAIVTGPPRQRSPAVSHVEISQITPNPVRSEASIHFALPSPGPARLDVFDVQGRLVAALIHGELRQAGYQQASIRTDRWQSGIYFCRLEAGGHSASKKMLLIR